MSKSFEADAVDDVLWFICTLCQRAYTSTAQSELREHKWRAHNSRGMADTIILSQKYDLQPILKITRWPSLQEHRYDYDPATNVDTETCDDESEEKVDQGQHPNHSLRNCTGSVSGLKKTKMKRSSKAKRKVGKYKVAMPNQSSHRRLRSSSSSSPRAQILAHPPPPNEKHPAAAISTAPTNNSESVRNHTSSSSTTCKICLITFPTLGRLKKHVLTLRVAEPEPEPLAIDQAKQIKKQVALNDSQNYGKVVVESIKLDDAVAVADLPSVEEVEGPVNEECGSRSPESSADEEDEEKKWEKRRLRRAKIRQLTGSRSRSKILPALRFNCKLCPKAFGREETLARHENTAHASKADRTCKICGKVCKTRKYLHVHVQIWHERPRPHTQTSQSSYRRWRPRPRLQSSAPHRAQILSQSQPPHKEHPHPVAAISTASSSSIATEWTCKPCLITFPTQGMLKLHVLLLHVHVKEPEPLALAIDQTEDIRKQGAVDEPLNYDYVVAEANAAEAGLPSYDEVDGQVNEECGPTESETEQEDEEKKWERRRLRRGKIRQLTGAGSRKPPAQQFPPESNIDEEDENEERRCEKLRELEEEDSNRPAERFNCKLCLEAFVWKEALSRHENKKHTSKADRTCKPCGKVYKTRRGLRVHVQNIHDESPRPHICTICGRSFSREALLRKHEKTHIKVYACDRDACTFATSAAAALKAHKLTHNPASFKCLECGAMLKSEHILQLHRSRKHSVERPFKCELCDLRFKAAQELRVHKARHVTDRQFLCEKCPKTFKTQRSLYLHTRRHGPPKIHSCRECGQKFAGPITLARHEMQVHDLRRPGLKYKCNHCGKFFPTKSNLDIHLATHEDASTRVRPFVCDTCGKAFATNTNLVQHSVTHLAYEEFKHVCEVCGKRFPLPHHVRQHKKAHHQDACGRTTRTDNDKPHQDPHPVVSPNIENQPREKRK